MTSSNLQAVLFDMDGVLFESIAAHKKAFRTLLKEIGIKKFNYSDVAGMSTRNALKSILKKSAIPFTLKQLSKWTTRKQHLSYNELKKRPSIRSGTSQTLNTLRRHFVLGLVSSAGNEKIRLFLKASQTRPFFSFVISGEDVRQAKPHPQIYRLAIRKLKMKPEKILVVEDSVSGVKSALAAGTRVVALRGTCPGSVLRKAGAPKVLNHLRDLISYATNY